MIYFIISFALKLVFQKRKKKDDFIFSIELVFLKINCPFTFKLYLAFKKYEGKEKNVKKNNFLRLVLRNIKENKI